MGTVGVLARFEAKPEKEADVERLFNEGVSIVQQQPASTAWYAFRMGRTTFGAFAAFTNEEQREALLAVGGPALAEQRAELFTLRPVFQKVDIIAAKLPVGENSVTVGSLVHFEAKPGKVTEWERYLKEGALQQIERAPRTTAWYALRVGPATSAVFDVFPDEAGRQTHFLAGAVRAEQGADLLAIPPFAEMVDVLAAKFPGESSFKGNDTESTTFF